MENSKKLRCFVAMAFGRKDTDLAYEQVIKPAIMEAGFIAIRIDQLTHNDRIDIRIREEILKADVMVADLTYARPSVYWEAGFAERVIPVIYTCRKDHFTVVPGDDFGNFKVHFDLANANIIPWIDNDKNRFNNELKKRLIFATKKQKAEKEKSNKIKDGRKEFAKISPRERARNLISITLPLFKKYKYLDLGILSSDSITNQYGTVIQGGSNLVWKRISSTIILISVHPTYLTLNKKQLELLENESLLNRQTLWQFIDKNRIPKEILEKFGKNVRSMRRIKIVPILSKINEYRIQDVFFSWRNDGETRWYYRPISNKPFSPREKPKLVASSSEVIFIDHILSTSEYIERLENVINELELAKYTVFTPSKK